jgi:hypothetical protein
MCRNNSCPYNVSGMSFLDKFKVGFTINTLFIGIFLLIISGGVTSYWLTKSDPYEAPIGMLPVPIQVGRNKISVSKTGDASMRTEYNRRRTIIGSNSGSAKKFGFSGFTNGAVETFFLSSILPTKLYRSSGFGDVILLDGGDAVNAPNLILDGNGGDVFNSGDIFIDGGNAYTYY